RVDHEQVDGDEDEAGHPEGDVDGVVDAAPAGGDGREPPRTEEMQDQGNHDQEDDGDYEWHGLLILFCGSTLSPPANERSTWSGRADGRNSFSETAGERESEGPSRASAITSTPSILCKFRMDWIASERRRGLHSLDPPEATVKRLLLDYDYDYANRQF